MVLTWNLDQKHMTERKYTRTKLSNNYILTGNYDHMLFSSQVLTDLDTMKVVLAVVTSHSTSKFHMLKKKLLSCWKWKGSAKILNTVWSLSPQSYAFTFTGKLMLSPGKMLKSLNHINLFFLCIHFFPLWLYVYQVSGFKSCYKTFIFQGNVYWNCNFDLGCSRWMSLLIKNIWSLVFQVFINVWPAFMVYALSCLDRFRAHVTYIFLLIWNAEEMGKSK